MLILIIINITLILITINLTLTTGMKTPVVVRPPWAHVFRDYSGQVVAQTRHKLELSRFKLGGSDSLCVLARSLVRFLLACSLLYVPSAPVLLVG